MPDLTYVPNTQKKTVGQRGPDKKIRKNPKKLTPKDKLILKNYNPEKSTYANLKPLDDQGLIAMDYGYKRLKKNQYLSEKISAIHAHWEEFLAREAMPEAKKKLMAKLKGKDGDTFPATKLVIDTYYKRQDQPPVQINTYIEQIHQLFGGMGDRSKVRSPDQIVDLSPACAGDGTKQV